MKTKREKFNYEARVIWECPCCGHRWSDDKLDYCPNCEVRMTYPFENLYPEVMDDIEKELYERFPYGIAEHAYIDVVEMFKELLNQKR